MLRFLTLLKAVALCHSFSDKRSNRNTHPQIEITLSDYCAAWEVLHDAFAATYRNQHPQTLETWNATQVLYATRKRPISVNELAVHLGWQPAVVYKWVKTACQAGLLRYEGKAQPKNVKRVLPGPTPYSEFLPHPNIVFENSEIIEPIKSSDPLTGETRVIEKSRKWAEEAE